LSTATATLSRIEVNAKIFVAMVILGLSLAYFFYLMAPDMTWANVGYDAPNYVASAEELRLSHPSPGSPLYNLFNAGWIRMLPGDNSFWEIGLVSVISSSLIAMLLFLISKSIIPTLVWLASGVVVSQSTIVESYTLVSLFMLGAYWLYKSEKRFLAYSLLSFGVMVHHLAIIPIIIFAIRDLWLYFNVPEDTTFVQALTGKDKPSLKPFLGILVAVPLLAYIPLANREPFIWIGGESIGDYYRYWFSQGGLLGGLSVVPYNDLLERVGDFLIVVLGSVGIVLPFIYLSFKKSKDWLLVALAITPMIYYATNLAPQVYTYVVPSIMFVGLLAAGKVDWSNISKIRPILIVNIIPLLVLPSLVGLNIVWYNQDSSSSALTFYNSLDKLPKDSFVWSGSRGWEKQTVELYNYRNSTNIDTINVRKSFRSEEDRNHAIHVSDSEGKLYRTVVTDLSTYEVVLIRTTAVSVIEDLEALTSPIVEEDN